MTVKSWPRISGSFESILDTASMKESASMDCSPSLSVSRKPGLNHEEDNLGIWRNWAAVYMPAVARMMTEVEGWPQLFSSGDLTIYQNPSEVSP